MAKKKTDLDLIQVSTRLFRGSVLQLKLEAKARGTRWQQDLRELVRDALKQRSTQRNTTIV